MANKTEMEIVGDGAAWIVKKVNAETGKVSDAETYHASKPADDRQIGGILMQEFKHFGTRRDAWQSMMSVIFASPRLAGYMGTGNTGQARPGETYAGGDGVGKISRELKNAVLDAEKEYLRGLVEHKHVKLKIEQGSNEEQAFQQFASSVNNDKNYSNLKSTVIRFFHFCGQLPVTESGYLVPVPVMQARIAETLVRKEPDNTVAGKLRAIKELMDKGTIAAEDAIDSLAYAKELVATLEGITNYYAEMATAKRGNSALNSVDQQAEAAIQGIMRETVEA